MLDLDRETTEQLGRQLDALNATLRALHDAGHRVAVGVDDVAAPGDAWPRPHVHVELRGQDETDAVVAPIDAYRPGREMAVA